MMATIKFTMEYMNILYPFWKSLQSEYCNTEQALNGIIRYDCYLKTT